MAVMPNFAVYRNRVAVATVLLLGATVFAQETNDEAVGEEAVVTSEAIEETEAIEEIIVFAPRPGSRKRVDQEYEDPIRAKLLKDFYKMQEEEAEFNWRKSAAAENPSRITWGYDPRDEYRMRNEMDLHTLPSQNVKPATLFRVDF